MSNKCRVSENIAKVKGNDVISGNAKTADVFDEFFANAVTNLNVTLRREILSFEEDISDPDLSTTEKYRTTPVSKQ